MFTVFDGMHWSLSYVYRPGSTAPTTQFFDDLADVLERASTYACPLILLGDVNLHLDVTDNPHTIK